MRGFPVDAAGALELYLETVARLGRVVPQTLSGTLVYSVRDEGYSLDRDLGQAGVRTSKTRSAIGFHTDPPSRMAGHKPDVLGLLVLQTAKSGGESLFVDGRAVSAEMRVERSDYFERLTRPFALYIEKGAELAGVALTGFEREALDYLEDVCERLSVRMQLQRGDIQFLNNVTHLHGRTAYEDYPEPERKRHYLRIWVEREDTNGDEHN